MNHAKSELSKQHIPRILVIEDDFDVAEVTTLLVKKYSGGDCDWVEDSYSAIDAVYEKHFDYWIVDQNLPGLKGFEVLKAVDKAIDRDPILNSETRFLKPISVILMSGSDFEIPKDLALKHFVIQDFVPKQTLSLGLARNLAAS